jgi:imidazole glycerol-phosphate synthase subunit HisH
MRLVGLVDYGGGNVTSVRNALTYLAIPFLQTVVPDQLDQVTHIILPGVGSFGSVMDRIERTRFLDKLTDQVVVRKKPFLGICVGMQILAAVGDEFGEHAGLGFIDGRVTRIDTGEQGLTLPHVGWNEVRTISKSVLFRHLGERPNFYFVHSYHLETADKQMIIGTCSYGKELVAAVENENVFGVQFHPEKSQVEGLQLLKNFVSL